MKGSSLLPHCGKGAFWSEEFDVAFLKGKLAGLITEVAGGI